MENQQFRQVESYYCCLCFPDSLPERRNGWAQLKAGHAHSESATPQL